jgi:formyltetrahydrofolate-dependent phosphoribosylglycinamide formyltransferase
MTVPVRLAVLASGGGSNLQALLDYFDGSSSHRAEVALVLSNRADAGALQRARVRDVDARVLASHVDGDALLQTLRDAEIGLVVLAGYLKLVPAAVTRAFRGRMLNVHPALLPAFGGPGMYGQRVHQAVLDAGVRVSGPTVHFVDDVYDRGAIAAQWPVPVLAGDSAESLAARVLTAEHALFPRTVEAVAEGRLLLDDASGCVRGSLFAPADLTAFVLSTDPTLTLAEVMDAALAR